VRRRLAEGRRAELTLPMSASLRRRAIAALEHNRVVRATVAVAVSDAHGRATRRTLRGRVC
jgi:hypothetical protein